MNSVFLCQHHASGHSEADDIGPSLRKIEYVRVEQRAGDVLGNDDKTNPRRKTAATTQQQMGDPHGPEYRNTKDAELYSNSQRLIMRIGSGHACCTGLTSGGFFKQRADRAGPVTDHRRLPYELSRLFPEFQPFAG